MEIQQLSPSGYHGLPEIVKVLIIIWLNNLAISDEKIPHQEAED
nr:hypothetical protein [Arthrospira sp. SH-MAG29]